MHTNNNTDHMTHDSGTIIKYGPLTPFFSIRYVINAIVSIVLPRPISSASIPLRLLLYSDTNHSSPFICVRIGQYKYYYYYTDAIYTATSTSMDKELGKFCYHKTQNILIQHT